MILKRLFLEEFGKFKNYAIDFQEGFNVVYGCNEAGKSTLMAFITMMLYGQNYTKRDGSFRHDFRNRFWPQGSDSMKGTIFFESQSINYLLDRTFKKTYAKDVIVLKNAVTHEVLPITEKTPGEEILGMTKSEFEKSVFILQAASSLGEENNEDINRRLSNLLSSGDESISHDLIIERLEEARTRLRSKRGDKGKIVTLERDLEALDDQLEFAKREEKRKADQQIQLDRIMNEEAQEEALVREIDEKIGHCRLIVRRDRLARQLEVADLEAPVKPFLDDLLFLPDATSLIQICEETRKDWTREQNDLEALESVLRERQEEWERHNRPLISQEQLEALKVEQNNLEAGATKLKRDQANLHYLEVGAELQELERKRTDLEKDKKTMEDWLALVDAETDLEEKQLRWEALRRIEEAERSIALRSATRRFRAILSSSIVTLTLIVILMALLVRLSFLAGLLIPAFLLFFCLKKRNLKQGTFLTGSGKSEASVQKEEKSSLDVIQGEIKYLETHILALKGRLGAEEDEGARSEPWKKDKKRLAGRLSELDRLIRNTAIAIGILAETRRKYLESGMIHEPEVSMAELDSLRSEIKDTAGKLDDQQERFASSLIVYGVEDLQALTDLYREDRDYLKTIEEVDQKRKKVLEIEETVEDNFRRLGEHLSPYRSIGNFEEAKQAVEELENIRQTLVIKKARLDSLYEGNVKEEIQDSDGLKKRLLELDQELSAGNITEAMTENPVAFRRSLRTERTKATDKLSILRSELAALKAKGGGFSGQALNVSQIQREIYRKGKQKEWLERNFEALDCAGKVIGQAFDELQQRFGPEVNDRTAFYLSQLTDRKYDQAFVTKKMELSVGNKEFPSGHQSLLHMSEGTKDQSYLALRLAIADLAFSDGRAPPLFLDDIFTQYDDYRAVKGLEILKDRLQRTKAGQTVLFTCHKRIREEARKLGGIHIHSLED